VPVCACVSVCIRVNVLCGHASLCVCVYVCSCECMYGGGCLLRLYCVYGEAKVSAVSMECHVMRVLRVCVCVTCVCVLRYFDHPIHLGTHIVEPPSLPSCHSLPVRHDGAAL